VEPELDVEEQARLRSYADRFNARDWTEGHIRGIRDFRYAKYIADGLEITRL